MLKVALEKKKMPDLRLMNKAVCASLNWGMWKTVGVVMMAAPHWSECDPVQYGRVSSRPPGSLWPAWSWCVQYSRSHPPTARCLQLHRCCTRMVSLETYLQNETQHVNRNKLFRLKLFLHYKHQLKKKFLKVMLVRSYGNLSDSAMEINQNIKKPVNLYRFYRIFPKYRLCNPKKHGDNCSLFNDNILTDCNVPGTWCFFHQTYLNMVYLDRLLTWVFTWMCLI